MYKKHQFILAILLIMVSIGAYCVEVDFYCIASEMINLVSIALAIYSIVLGALCGDSELAKKMRSTPDSIYKDRTQQGVLNSYISQALLFGILTIVIAAGIMIVHDDRWLVYLYSYSEDNLVVGLTLVYRIASSIAIGLAGANFFYIGVIAKFIMNRLVWNK